jgi:RIO-like serine/threonine protein kinase
VARGSGCSSGRRVIIQHWPQYVEVGHERAGELLEWDVRNGLAFFWRRYGMEQGLDEKMK